MRWLRLINPFYTRQLERETAQLRAALPRQRDDVRSLLASIGRQAEPGSLTDLHARLLTAQDEVQQLDSGIYRATELLTYGRTTDAGIELLSLLQRQIARNEREAM
jgi:hypothetical protein